MFLTVSCVLLRAWNEHASSKTATFHTRASNVMRSPWIWIRVDEHAKPNKTKQQKNKRKDHMKCRILYSLTNKHDVKYITWKFHGGNPSLQFMSHFCRFAIQNDAASIFLIAEHILEFSFYTHDACILWMKKLILHIQSIFKIYYSQYTSVPQCDSLAWLFSNIKLCSMNV